MALLVLPAVAAHQDGHARRRCEGAPLPAARLGTRLLRLGADLLRLVGCVPRRLQLDHLQVKVRVGVRVGVRLGVGVGVGLGLVQLGRLQAELLGALDQLRL
eukprot:scaffold16501_cov72-Phaeocystis_antarctica.AAC.4